MREIIGTPGYIHGDGLSTEQRLNLVGQNTGNLVFQMAVAALFPEPKRFLSLAPDSLRPLPGSDFTIFPAANNLRIGGISEPLMTYLEQVGQNAVVIGLGVPSELSMRPAEILGKLINDPVQTRFLAWLRNLDSAIGVRGDITSQVLALAGIDSLVTGCPSLTLNKSEDLGQEIARSLERIGRAATSGVANGHLRNSDWPRAAVTAAATWEVYNRQDQTLLDVERQLFQLAVETQGSYIQQSGGSEIVDISEGRLRDYPEAQRTSMARILGWQDNEGQFLAAFSTVSKVFFNAETWLSVIREHDFSIGTRVHGNMLGIAAGIASIFIPHDSRTQELIDSMKVPWVSQTDINKVSSLAEIIASVQFDADAFDERRRELSRNLEKCISSA